MTSNVLQQMKVFVHGRNCMSLISFEIRGFCTYRTRRRSSPGSEIFRLFGFVLILFWKPSPRAFVRRLPCQRLDCFLSAWYQARQFSFIVNDSFVRWTSRPIIVHSYIFQMRYLKGKRPLPRNIICSILNKLI